MKKVIVIGMILALAGSVYAAQQTLGTQDATKTGLSGMIVKINAMMTEIYGGLTTNGVTRLETLESTVVTNATLTKSAAAITATAAVTPVTFVPSFILADGTTNAVAIMTNATVAVTVVNGGAVLTNIVINLNP